MAAATLQINSIDAPVISRYPVVPYGGGPVNTVPRIWPLAAGAAAPPIAFWPEINPNSLQVSFTFQNNGAAPWTGAPATARCTIEGQGPNGTVIQSAQIAIPPNGTATTASSFTLPPNLNFAFADLGAWQWTIVYIPPAGAPGPRVTSTTTTNLDLYIYRGPRNAMLFPRLPGQMLRMMFPTYNQLYGAGVVNARAALYAQIVTRVWQHGLYLPPNNMVQYDSRFGVGGGVSYLAGPNLNVFNWSAWDVRWRPFCNCADLAAFVFLACRLYGILGILGPQVLPARVRYANPFGQIVPGYLFGWPNNPQGNPNCNNPFWLFNPINPLPNTGNTTPGRMPFSTHSYVAVPTAVVGGAGDAILEACHAVGAAPAGFPQATQAEVNYHVANVNNGPFFVVPPVPPNYQKIFATGPGPVSPIQYADWNNQVASFV